MSVISTHSVKVGKKTHKLKASTLAQARLEEMCDGAPIGQLLEKLITGSGGVSLVVKAWAAFLNDGKGVEMEEAGEILDALGGVQSAAEHLGKALQIAFPFLQEGDGDQPAEDGAGKAASPAA